MKNSELKWHKLENLKKKKGGNFTISEMTDNIECILKSFLNYVINIKIKI